MLWKRASRQITPCPSGLVRLAASDVRPASQTLAQAFQDDPLFVFLIPNPEGRRYILKIYFGALIRQAVFYREAYATSKDFEGVIALLPPRVPEVSYVGLICSGVFWAALSKPLLGRIRSSRRTAANPIAPDRPREAP
jgi:hypothetical protein